MDAEHAKGGPEAARAAPGDPAPPAGPAPQEDPSKDAGPGAAALAPAPAPSATAAEPPSPAAAPGEDDEEDRLQGDEWVAPRRIAIIVSFALALALFFGTAAALLRIPNSLPWSGGMALIGGIAEVPPLVLFSVGRPGRTISLAPLLLLAAGAGVESYFVGGTVGVGSPTTLGAGVICLALFILVGHPTPESFRRRVRRVRRWSRNGVVFGLIFLLLAAAFYGAYVNSPGLQAVSSAKLTTGTTLIPGEQSLENRSAGGSIVGSSGDLLYLLLGASNATVGITGSLVNAAGDIVANVTAGNLTSPQIVYLQLRVAPGTYAVYLDYPSSAGAPTSVDVRWSVGDIPADVQALTGALWSSGWAGFALVIICATVWVVAREPPPKTKRGTAGAAGSSPEEGTPPSATSQEGAGTEAGAFPGWTLPTEDDLKDGTDVSDKGMTEPPAPVSTGDNG